MESLEIQIRYLYIGPTSFVMSLKGSDFEYLKAKDVTTPRPVDIFIVNKQEEESV
jgi:hypothetical protein